MELGMIGLGRMGANMVERLMKAGHHCVVYDSHADAVQQSVAKGAKGTTSLADFVKTLSKPRAVWLMLPAAAVDSVLHSLVPLLEPGDIVIEGGNSYYHDDIRRAGELRGQGPALCRCRRQRRRVGAGARLLPHDRRRGCDRAASRSDLPLAGAGRRGRAAHAGRHRRAEPGRVRLSALRSERRRALRQDGAQRHRIRPDGRLCRRVQHHQAMPMSAWRSTRSTPRPRRCAIPNTTATRSMSRRSPRSGGAAAWSAPGCWI